MKCIKCACDLINPPKYNPAEGVICDRCLPAFPLEMKVGDISKTEGGLTKREYFAACAMQGLMGTLNDLKTDYSGQKTPKFLAYQAVKIADALINQLSLPDNQYDG